MDCVSCHFHDNRFNERWINRRGIGVNRSCVVPLTGDGHGCGPVGDTASGQGTARRRKHHTCFTVRAYFTVRVPFMLAWKVQW